MDDPEARLRGILSEVIEKPRVPRHDGEDRKATRGDGSEWRPR